MTQYCDPGMRDNPKPSGTSEQILLHQWLQIVTHGLRCNPKSSGTSEQILPHQWLQIVTHGLRCNPKSSGTFKQISPPHEWLNIVTQGWETTPNPVEHLSRFYFINGYRLWPMDWDATPNPVGHSSRFHLRMNDSRLWPSDFNTTPNPVEHLSRFHDHMNGYRLWPRNRQLFRGSSYLHHLTTHRFYPSYHPHEFAIMAGPSSSDWGMVCWLDNVIEIDCWLDIKSWGVQGTLWGSNWNIT